MNPSFLFFFFVPSGPSDGLQPTSKEALLKILEHGDLLYIYIYMWAKVSREKRRILRRRLSAREQGLQTHLMCFCVAWCSKQAVFRFHVGETESSLNLSRETKQFWLPWIVQRLVRLRAASVLLLAPLLVPFRFSNQEGMPREGLGVPSVVCLLSFSGLPGLKRVMTRKTWCFGQCF